MIGFIIGFIILLGVRLVLGYLAGETVTFSTWYFVLKIAVWIFAAAALLSIVFYFIKKWKELPRDRTLKDQFAKGSEPMPGGERRYREKSDHSQERKRRKAERCVQRENRAFRRKAEREKIQRVEALEKRRRRELKEEMKNYGKQEEIGN